ncbi:Csu type fimbrial protein [Salmonella enterica]
MDNYTGQSSAIAYNGTNYTLGYSVYGTAGTGSASPNPAPTSVAAGAGLWYGVAGTQAVGTSGTTNGPLLSSIRITIPAGAARTVPPGTYTVTVRFTLDMQGGASTGSPCTKAGQSGPDGDGQDWGTVTYTFTIVVPKVCSIDAINNIDFGNIPAIDVVPADINAEGSVYFTCSLSTPYTMYMGDGLHRASSGERNMAGSDGSSLLPYQLYTTAGRTTIWDSTTGISGTGTAVQTFNTVYGKIATGSVLPRTLGAYQDSVIVTISY